MRNKLFLLFICCLVVQLSIGQTQKYLVLNNGTSLNFTKIQFLNDDSITVLNEAGSVILLLDSVKEYHKKRPSHMGLAVTVGAVSGAIIGAAIAYGIADDGVENIDNNKRAVIGLSAVGAIVGGGIGALIGKGSSTDIDLSKYNKDVRKNVLISLEGA